MIGRRRRRRRFARYGRPSLSSCILPLRLQAFRPSIASVSRRRPVSPSHPQRERAMKSSCQHPPPQLLLDAISPPCSRSSHGGRSQHQADGDAHVDAHAHARHRGAGPGNPPRPCVCISRIVHSPCPRASPHAKGAESVAADAILCCRNAGTILLPCPTLAPLGLTANRQCTKAGVECMFYDHGRNQLLPRR